MNPTDAPTRDELEAAHCWVPGTDRVPNRPDITAFKQRARLHQARWREAHGLPIGSQPITPGQGEPSRPIGSRIAWPEAEQSRANLISPGAVAAAANRLANPQPHQTLNTQRAVGRPAVVDADVLQHFWAVGGRPRPGTPGDPLLVR